MQSLLLCLSRHFPEPLGRRRFPPCLPWIAPREVLAYRASPLSSSGGAARREGAAPGSPPPRLLVLTFTFRVSCEARL